MCPYYRTISRFSLCSHVHFCCISKCFIFSSNILENQIRLFLIKYPMQSCTYIMDYGVHIWTSIPFEYSPFAATLLVLLSTHFRLFQLSFDLSQKWLINTALILAEFAPYNNLTVHPFLSLFIAPFPWCPTNHCPQRTPQDFRLER